MLRVPKVKVSGTVNQNMLEALTPPNTANKTESNLKHPINRNNRYNPPIHKKATQAIIKRTAVKGSR